MVRFVEAPGFTRRVADYLDDAELAALQWTLATRPEAGTLIPGSGGLRKLRWRGSGRGKSGGYRIIYFFWRPSVREIWLLAVYAKNEETDLPADVLWAIREEIEK
ncbi:MAG: hypothetical protein KatS3mg117_2218 [Geminicoccaceae bacterium]|nr:MAG: hypothetical protein KatS3mg117_2218 [Geminicoccaceae bacterium]